MPLTVAVARQYYASPGTNTVQAGSSDSQVHVTFTAAGTMKDGQVILELPPGWGAFQRDPVEPNYIAISGSGASLTEPAIGSSSTRAIAKINEPTWPDWIIHVCLWWWNRCDQNGVDAQDHLGPAEFIIKSDGNGDSVSLPQSPAKRSMMAPLQRKCSCRRKTRIG